MLRTALTAWIIAGAVCLAPGALAQPAPAPFTYQGHLTYGGLPADGAFDLRYRVYVSETSDILLRTQYIDDHPITDGLFTVELDPTALYNGNDRWIEVSVRLGSVPNSDRSDASYTRLGGRQQIRPTPYALHAYEASGLRLPIDETANILGVNFRITNGSATAIHGASETGVGIYASATSGTGILASSENGWAGAFHGPVYTNGRIGIGYAASTTLKLACNGDAGKPGGGMWSVLSDERMKHDIVPLSGALDRLLSLRGYTFEYSDAALDRGLALAGPQIGLVAQQVERVFPEWVAEDEDGTKYVTERGTTALFVEAPRELRAEKDAEIAELREALDALRAQVAKAASAAEQN